MKKFGVRALACGLAAFMVAGSVAPAAANAEDVLLVATPDSVETLYITEDMVDSDGEIVISGEDWDRVVISKEAAAKDIYFDQVNIGELVVESGSTSNIQLWEVEAEKLTVTEPKLNPLTISDLRSLLADPETQQTAVDLYLKNAAQNEQTLKNAPSIVTMQDAKIGEVSTRANVVFDFAEGNVGAVALEASEQLERVNVTLKNYDGEVSYKGGESVSITTLKMVDSNISKLTVNESAANNYLNVDSKNSSASSVEIAGNAQVALNVQATELEITEEATKAQVAVMNKVKTMSVAADGAQVEVAPGGNVSSATVEGDNVNIVGSGTLKEVDITGKGAYVSTEGTAVEGENSYVKPVYVETPYDTWSENFADADIDEKINQNMNGGTFVYNEEGYGVASSAVGWEGFSVTLDNKDNGSRASYVISMKVKKLGGSATQVRMTTPPGCSASYMSYVDLTGQWQTITSDRISVPAGASVTVMVAPTDNAHTLELAVDDVVVKRYTEWTEPAERPVVTEDKTFTFENQYLSDYVSYNVPVEYSADENGALVMKTNGLYQAVIFKLPEVVNAADYSKLKVFLTSTAGEVAVKVWRVGETGSGGNPATLNYAAVSNPEIDLSGIFGEDIEKIEFAAQGSGAATITVEKVVFVAAGASTGGSGEGGNTGSGDGGSGDDNQGGSENKPTTEAAAPSKLPDSYLVYNVGDLTDGGFSGVTPSEASNGGIKFTYAGQYNEAKFKLPKELTVGDYEKMIVTISSTTDAVALKMYNAAGEEIGVWYNREAEETTDITVGLNGKDECYPTNRDIQQDASIGFVGVMSNNGACEAVIYRVAFVPKEGNQNPIVPPTTEVEDDIIIAPPDSDELKVGASITLTATPSGTTGDVIWTSSNIEVATVVGGKVTAHKAGTVEITASYGTAEKTIELTVVDYVTITTPATDTVTLVVGDELQFEVDTYESAKVEWKSSDDTVATVSSTGLVKAVSGSAVAVTITATVGEVSDSVSVKVQPRDAKYIEIAGDANREIFVDEELTLTATTKGGEGEIEWSVDKSGVVTVTNGVVTVEGTGTVTITASCEGYESAKVTLKVKDYSVTVTPEKDVLYVGETTKVNVVTDAGKDAKIEFESSKPEIATVDEDGVVTANGAGKVTITVFCEGKFEETTELEVMANYVNVKEQTITLRVGEKLELATLIDDSSQTVVWNLKDNDGVAKIENGYVFAETVGTATITVTTVAGDDVPVEIALAVKEGAPDGGTLCTPIDGFSVMLFDSKDLRTYAGTTVTIEVSVCKRGDAEIAVHLQTNEKYQGVAGEEDSWSRPIIEEWTTYKSDFAVPAEWKSHEKPIYFGLLMCRADQGQGELLYDYDACDVYYKDFSIEEKVIDEISEFDIVTDVTFNEEVIYDDVNGFAVAQLEQVYLAGDSLVNIVKSEPALADDADSYKTLAGIMDKIEYFEVTVNLTEGTPQEGLENGIYWAPQAQIQTQSTNYSEGSWNCFTKEQNEAMIMSLGQPNGSPITGSAKLYTEYFENWTSLDENSLNMIQLQFLNAQLGTDVSGTYSIKAVLRK